MDISVTTQSMMRKILRTGNLDRFLRDNAQSFREYVFCDLLQQFCKDKQLSIASVIENAQIERTYGYQLFNGTRQPSRDKVLQLAIGLSLNVEETQQLLRSAGKNTLYPKIRRDAVILYGINKGLTFFQIQEYLTHYGLTSLGRLNYDGN